jgi:hypothetical protein
VKRSRALVANFARASWVTTAKICFGLLAAAFLLQSYYIRELVFAEAFIAMVFITVGLLAALCVVGRIAVRGAHEKSRSVAARVSARYRQPSARKMIDLTEAKEEV